MYGRGFWYADPLYEFNGLTENQLYWTPDANCMCLLWHAGHIAERECRNLGQYCPDCPGYNVPKPYRVFAEWSNVKDVRGAGPWTDVFNWVRDVREESHRFIDSIKERWHEVPPDSREHLSIASWVFITAGHTAEHIGRIKHIKAMLLRKPEEVC
jgi:hypothetical protein